MERHSKYHAEGEVPFCGSVRSSGGGSMPVECEHEDADDPNDLDVDQDAPQGGGEGPEAVPDGAAGDAPGNAGSDPGSTETPAQGPDEDLGVEEVPGLPA